MYLPHVTVHAAYSFFYCLTLSRVEADTRHEGPAFIVLLQVAADLLVVLLYLQTKESNSYHQTEWDNGNSGTLVPQLW